MRPSTFDGAITIERAAQVEVLKIGLFRVRLRMKIGDDAPIDRWFRKGQLWEGKLTMRVR